MSIFDEIINELNEQEKCIIIQTDERGFGKGHIFGFIQYYFMLKKIVITEDFRRKGCKRITNQLTLLITNPDVLDKSKQKIAFKANLIHHLDAI